MEDLLEQVEPAVREPAEKNDFIEREATLLAAVLRDEHLACCLAASPGGWRTQSEHELERMKLQEPEVAAVMALQELVSRAYPILPRHRMTTAADVARVYGHRLGGQVTESMIAVALDGQNHVLGEVEVARGGAHGLAIAARDVLRPLIRLGCSGFVLVHNHPSGDPTPSGEDIAMTVALSACGDVVGVQLVDHIIVGARGGGFVSLFELGVIQEARQ